MRMRAPASTSAASGISFEQPDTLAQRAGEFDLAIHRAPRDLGDLRLDAGDLGELVEHLIGDDRRFHIGDEKLLAPAGGVLRQHIDRDVAPKRDADAGIGLIGGEVIERDVANAAGGKPIARLEPCAELYQRLARYIDGAADCIVAGARGDQGDDAFGHAGLWRGAAERQASWSDSNIRIPSQRRFANVGIEKTTSNSRFLVELWI